MGGKPDQKPDPNRKGFISSDAEPGSETAPSGRRYLSLDGPNRGVSGNASNCPNCGKHTFLAGSHAVDGVYRCVVSR